LLGTGIWRADARWQPAFETLERAGRAFRYTVTSANASPTVFWGAVERFAWAQALHPDPLTPPPGTVRSFSRRVSASGGLDASSGAEVDEGRAIAHVLRGHLETTGPVDAVELAGRLAVRPGLVEIGLAGLESEGFVLRGRFETCAEGRDVEQFCARRLLARIHADSQVRLRASVEPVPARDFMRFLLDWQHVTPGHQLDGAEGVARVVEQLQGFDLAAGAWESEVLAARVRGYRPELLDAHCLSGRVSWLRMSPPASNHGATREGGDADVGPPRSTHRATPLSLVLRADLPWLLQAHRTPPPEPRDPVEGTPAQPLLALLEERGALFHGELVASLGLAPAEVERALWDLVARGRVGADGFQALRALLRAREGPARTSAQRRVRRGLRRGLAAGAEAAAEGRWSRVPERAPVEDPDELAEAIAEQLLVRWGIVFRDVVAREQLAIPWREVTWALRRLEARGAIRGGRFVAGFTGEQFALPEALDALARVRQRPRDETRIRVCAADPLNLVGRVVPGKRVPALRTREVVYLDGMPVDLPEAERGGVAASVARDTTRPVRRPRTTERETARSRPGQPPGGERVRPTQLELR
jgi:ATP-dependent Lhr-like helicase